MLDLTGSSVLLLRRRELILIGCDVLSGLPDENGVGRSSAVHLDIDSYRGAATSAAAGRSALASLDDEIS